MDGPQTTAKTSEEKRRKEIEQQNEDVEQDREIDKPAEAVEVIDYTRC